MTSLRWALCGVLVLLGVVLQASLFGSFAWDGVVPDLVLLVVVAVGLAEGGQAGMILGFAGGLLLDLAPPADHIAGRWALALLVVGYVAGRVGQGIGRIGVVAGVATVAGCSFVATAIYALTGVILHDHPPAFGHLAAVIGIALVWDIVLTPLVLPGVAFLLRRIEPARALR